MGKFRSPAPAPAKGKTQLRSAPAPASAPGPCLREIIATFLSFLSKEKKTANFIVNFCFEI